MTENPDSPVFARGERRIACPNCGNAERGTFGGNITDDVLTWCCEKCDHVWTDCPTCGGIRYTHNPALEMPVHPCPDCTQENPWTAEQLLYDLNDRIDRGVKELHRMRWMPLAEDRRLAGKIEGLRLVKDWLRSYE